MSDIDDIINELDRKYPKWLMDGLARSPEIKNIESALVKMSKLNVDANKGLKGLSKESEKLGKEFQDFDKTLGITKDSFDEMTDSSESLNKAHKSLSKSLLGVAGSILKSSPVKELAKGNVAGAFDDLSYGLRDASKTLGGFAGKAALGLGLVTDVVSRAVELITKNNASYKVLSQSGFRINDAFIGISKSAINANLSLEDFTELAAKNASVLAQWGPTSAKDLGLLSKNIRFNADLMGRMGYDVSEVNDYLTDYLQIQQRLGFLNKVTQKQMNDGFKEFISDASEFSNLIGYSRKDILETATKLADAPEWGFFIRSLGEGGKAVNDSFMQASDIISSIAGPEMGKPLGDLMQQLVSYGAPLTDETRNLVKNLQATDAPLLDLIYNTSDQVRAGKQASGSTEQFSKNLITSIKQFSNERALRLEAAGQLGDFGNTMNKTVSNVTNFNDRAEQTVGGMDALLKQQKETDSQNARSAGAMSEFNETIQAVKLTFETGLISVLDANKPALLNFADSMSKKILPAVLKFSTYLQGFMDDDTRQQMIDSIEDSIGDVIIGVFHKLAPGLVSAPEKTPRSYTNKNVAGTAGGAQSTMPLGSPGATGNVVEDRKRIAMNYLMSSGGGGYTKDQAAGIVGNMLQEDPSLNPSQAQLGGGPGYGLAQWGPERQADFKRRYGKDIKGSSFYEQLRFAADELKGNYGGSDTALRRTNNTTDAAIAVQDKFEKPFKATQNTQNRTAQAMALANTDFTSAGTINGITPATTAPADSSNAVAGVTSASSSPQAAVDQQNLSIQQEQLDHLKVIAQQNQDIAYLMRRQVTATSFLSPTN